MPNVPIMTGKCAMVYLAKSLIAEGRGTAKEFAAELKKYGIDLDEGSHEAVWQRATTKWVKEKTKTEDALEETIKRQARFLSDAENSTFADLVGGAVRAGLLSTARAFQGSFFGNMLSAAPEDIARLPSSIIDALLSIRSGERTLSAAGYSAGKKAAWSVDTPLDMVSTLLHGSSQSDLLKYMETGHKIKWQPYRSDSVLLDTPAKIVGAPVSWIVNKVFDVIVAGDVPRRREAYARAMIEASTLAAWKEGKRGKKAVTQRVRELMLESPDSVVWSAIHKMALDETAESLYTNHGYLVDIGKNVSKNLFGMMVMPFSTVPINVVGRGLEWTPIGIVYGAGKGFKFLIDGDPATQRKVAKALGRGIVGTAGGVALGYMLAQKGILNPPRSTDQGINDMNEAAGYPEGSVNVGDRSYGLVDIPQAWGMFVGAAMYWRDQAAAVGAKPEMGMAENLITSTVGTAVGQARNVPTLRGADETLKAFQDVQNDEGGEDYKDTLKNSRMGGNVANMLIPEGVSEIGRGNDPYRRSGRGFGERLAAESPGGDPGAIMHDVAGRPIQRNPGLMSQARNLSPDMGEKRRDPVMIELRRLQIPWRKPGAVNDPLKVDADRNEYDRQERIKALGTAAHSALKALISHPDWNKNSDKVKRELILEEIKYAQSEAREDLKDKRELRDPLAGKL